VITPLVKWAGGKRQLLTELNASLPVAWNTYYEPFFGGGALFADLFTRGRISRGVIADLNRELVNFYRIVRQHPAELMDELAGGDFENSAPCFSARRAEFNVLNCSGENPVRRAALLLYLNKHGYNGLWRVNSRGSFNVPFGCHKKRNIPVAETVLRFSQMLRSVKILEADFEAAVKTAKKGDLVYFDPPYHPISKTAGFTDYNSNGFRFEDQVRLARVFRRLSKKGIFVMLSNSKVPEIEELYDDFAIRTVEAKRFINCNGEKRRGVFEIIVTNYPAS